MARRQSGYLHLGLLAGWFLLMPVAGCAATAASRAPAGSQESGSAGKPASTAAAQPVPTPGADTQRVNLRALTVLVSAKPPPALGSTYGELARRASRATEFFLAAADGGFGSGSLVVHGKHRFIVTNRHVVDLATHVLVSFDSAEPKQDLAVAYVDPEYDLAIVIAPDAKPDAPAPVGLELDEEPVHDQQPVIASGYPAIGDAPSYQVTRGYISNERFELKRGGVLQNFIQHTAPIDPGSSGGPLTSEAGKLLGVNTLKARERESVGLAIPAVIVQKAIERAEVSLEHPEPQNTAEEARAACEALLTAMAAGDEHLERVERALGGDFVAEVGFQSLAAARSDRADLLASFSTDPTSALLTASAQRLIARAGAGKKDSKACTPVPENTGDPRPTFTVQLAGRATTWVLGWEQGRFKLQHDSSDAQPSAQQILERLGAVQPPKKKWKPSLR